MNTPADGEPQPCIEVGCDKPRKSGYRRCSRHRKTHATATRADRFDALTRYAECHAALTVAHHGVLSVIERWGELLPEGAEARLLDIAGVSATAMYPRGAA